MRKVLQHRISHRDRQNNRLRVVPKPEGKIIMKKKNLILVLLIGAISTCTFPIPTLASVNYDDASVIKKVQESLNKLGYNCGSPDGIIGGGTQTAINNFRSEKNLSPSTSIDDELLSSLGLIDLSDTRTVEFTPATNEVKNAIIAVQDDLFSELGKVFSSIGITEGTVIDYGNEQLLGDLITIDAKIRTATDKMLMAACMHVPLDNPAWDIRFIVDMEDGHYYYLDDDYGDVEHVYDYSTGLLLDSIEPDSKNTNTISINFSSSVANDVTGKWRLATVSTSKAIVTYALNYYQKYFKSDDEIHGIVNKDYNQTYCLSVVGGELSVVTHQYLEGEENDAALLFGGDVISQIFINLDTGTVSIS